MVSQLRPLIHDNYHDRLDRLEERLEARFDEVVDRLARAEDRLGARVDETLREVRALRPSIEPFSDIMFGVSSEPTADVAEASPARPSRGSNHAKARQLIAEAGRGNERASDILTVLEDHGYHFRAGGSSNKSVRVVTCADALKKLWDTAGKGGLTAFVVAMANAPGGPARIQSGLVHKYINAIK